MNSFVWRRYWPMLALLVAVRLVFWGGAFPNPDEAYYWLWGQHPDWSYFDHPPFHAWVQGGAAVLGRSPWVLRLPTLITTGLLFWLYWRICQHLYGRQARHGFWLTVLLVLSSPLFFLFLAMAWHDHWLIWFGTAASYCLVRCLASDRPSAYGWLYGAGVLVGLAGLCKYVALFLGLGFLGAIAIHPRGRSLFGNGHLYGAVAMALLVMAPIFWWNAQHDFLSFQFYLGRSVQTANPGVMWFGPLGFVLLSALIFGPVHSWIVLKAAWQGQTTRFGRTYQQVAFTLFGVSTGVLALLALRAPVLYYWNLLAYPLLFPLMAGVFLQRHRLTELRHRRLLTGAIALGAIVMPLLVMHYTVVPWSALVSETGDDDTRMVYGWSQVTAEMQRQSADFAEPPLWLTTDYRSAAALAYAGNQPDVLALSGRRDQFDVWYGPSELAGKDALLLGDRWHPICPAHLAMFERTDPPETLTVKRLGIFIKDYQIVKGYGFQTAAPNDDPFSPDYPLAFTTDGETCSP